MTVGRTGRRSIDVGRLYVPSGTSGMKDKTVAAFVTSTGAGPHRCQHMSRILLLNGERIAHSSGGACDRVSATFTAGLAALGRGGHRCMKGREFMHHALILVLFIGMNGLSMLTEIIKTRKLLATMASEGTLPSMFPANAQGKRRVSKMINFAKYAEGRGENFVLFFYRKEIKKNQKLGGGQNETYLMCLARCSLLLKTILHSP